jgi:FkbH-like protein
MNKRQYKRLSIQVAFLSRSNVDFLAKIFVQNAGKYCIDVFITEVPFGQWVTEINNHDSSLRKTKHDYLFFVETIDDMISFGSILSDNYLDKILRQWLIYLNNIKSCRKKVNGIIFIATPIYLSSWVSSINILSKDAVLIRDLIYSMNKQLLNLVNDIADTYIIDFDSILQGLGRKLSHPDKYKYLARMPFSLEFNQEISNYILGAILSLSGKSARLIVLDLDNTLWNGVVGDDGIYGISMDGDYPGNVYQVLQELFLILKNKGFALAIASKNTESIAMDAIVNHPDMVLSIDDFVVHKINWLPKSKNIREISDETGLGMDSICFIDDSVLERREVVAFFPEVFVPDLPEEVASWPEFILNLPELSYFNFTKEDAGRSDSYKLRTIINSVSDDMKERESFLESIEMSIYIELYSTKNKQRVLQLINKTNQFNTTTRRYNESNIEKLLKSGQCFAIRLKDNIGTNEIIGVVIIKIENNLSIIDTFLLSCRVLGRDIETAILYWLCQYLVSKKISRLYGEVIHTNRNKPVQRLYADHSFTKINNSSYELILSNCKIKKPAWVKIENIL